VIFSASTALFQSSPFCCENRDGNRLLHGISILRRRVQHHPAEILRLRHLFIEADLKGKTALALFGAVIAFAATVDEA
jgi:hypothetical protein